MIYKVNIKEITRYIENWSIGLLNDDRTRLYGYDNKANKWIGIDNRSDNCWVEEFKTENQVLKWLKSNV